MPIYTSIPDSPTNIRVVLNGVTMTEFLLAAHHNTLLRSYRQLTDIGRQREESHGAAYVAIVPEMPACIDFELHEGNLEGIEREGLVVLVDDELETLIGQSQVLYEFLVDNFDAA